MNDAATIIWRHGQGGIAVRCFGIDEMESQLRRTECHGRGWKSSKDQREISRANTPILYARPSISIPLNMLTYEQGRKNKIPLINSYWHTQAWVVIQNFDIPKAKSADQAHILSWGVNRVDNCLNIIHANSFEPSPNLSCSAHWV